MDLQPDLVGREDELRLITGHIERGAGVLLAGPAGIGKSRLARAVADRFEADGWTVVVVRATGSGRSVPLGALEPLIGPEIQHPRQALARLRQSFGEGTGLLLVDDVNQLDAESLYVLDGLAAIGVRLLATVRVGYPLPSTVEAMWTSGALFRLDLGPLREADIARFAAACLKGPVGLGLTRALARRSRGNPLYIRELLAGALSADRLTKVAGAWEHMGAFEAGPGLTLLVRSRIESLASLERTVLELIAMGDPLEIDDLEAMIDHASDLPAALLSLEHLGLVQTSASFERRAVAMAHPLYADVVIESMAGAHHRHLSAMLAQVVDSSQPRDRLRSVLWHIEAAVEPGPDLLVRGAEAAVELGAWELAERLSRMARDAGGGAEALYVLGSVLSSRGEVVEAEQMFLEADAAAPQSYLSVITGLALADLRFQSGADSGPAFEVLDELRRAHPGAAPFVTAQEALFHALAGHPADALEQAGRLLEEPDVFMYAALAASLGWCLAGRCEQAEGLALRAAARREELPDARQIPRATLYISAAAFACCEQGRFDDALRLVESGYDLSVAKGEAASEGWLSLVRGRVELARGGLAQAVEWFREAAVRFEELRAAPARWAWGGLTLALAQLGRVAETEAAFSQLEASRPSGMRMLDPDLERARAWRAALRGELARAIDMLEVTADAAAAQGQALLAAAAWHDFVRMAPAGHPTLRRAAAYLDEAAASTDNITLTAAAAHATALADGDAEQLGKAASGLAELGLLTATADAFAQAAAAAVAERGLSAGMSFAQQARRASRLAGSLATPALHALNEVAPITGREHEVAVLAGGGVPSRDIARQLYLSGRTVENHLANLYRKLGVSSRSQLKDALEAWWPGD